MSAVKSGLNELRDLGLVTWKGRARSSDGAQTSNDYRIHDDPDSLAGLFPPEPQSPEGDQEEETKEEPLNRSFHDLVRRKWNTPSDELPATDSQLDLIEVLATESEASRDVLDFVESDNLSRADAHDLIRQMKVARWKEENYG